MQSVGALFGIHNPHPQIASAIANNNADNLYVLFKHASLYDVLNYAYFTGKAKKR